MRPLSATERAAAHRFDTAPPAPESLRRRVAEALFRAQWNLVDGDLADQPEAWQQHFLLGADAAIAVVTSEALS